MPVGFLHETQCLGWTQLFLFVRGDPLDHIIEGGSATIMHAGAIGPLQRHKALGAPRGLLTITLPLFYWQQITVPTGTKVIIVGLSLHMRDCYITYEHWPSGLRPLLVILPGTAWGGAGPQQVAH